jgi:hypothetical protein
MKHIVKSREGIEFVVESEPRSVVYDVLFALARPAAELELHGDFQRVSDSRPLVAPEFVFHAPRIVGPLERRAAFKVIKGGKP